MFLRSLAVAVLFGAFSTLAQASYTFVGSWNVNDGPDWSDLQQPILTGRDAAALLFGGSASDYVISTNGSDENLINFSAWVSAFGQGHSGDIVGQDFFQDSGTIGVYDSQGDTSAYISDWCDGGNCINYAFRVPEPMGLGLFGLGLVVLGWTVRRQALSTRA